MNLMFRKDVLDAMRKFCPHKTFHAFPIPEQQHRRHGTDAEAVAQLFILVHVHFRQQKRALLIVGKFSQ